MMLVSYEEGDGCTGCQKLRITNLAGWFLLIFDWVSTLSFAREEKLEYHMALKVSLDSQ